MKNNKLSIEQFLALGIYNRFESDEIKIEFERIDRGDRTEIVFTVFDETGEILYEDSAYAI